MTIFLFSFALPVVIGYILFVGISGKISPLTRPSEDSHKPAWFLGIWTGLSVALTLALALNVAFRLTATSLEGLAVPTLALLVLLLAPGFIAWYWYKQKITQQLAAEYDLSDVTILTQETDDGISFYDEKAEELTVVNWDTQNIPLDSLDFEPSDQLSHSTIKDSSFESENGFDFTFSKFSQKDRDEFVLDTTKDPSIEDSSSIENSMKLTDVDQYNRSFWRSRRGVLNAIDVQSTETEDQLPSINTLSPDYDRAFDAARLQTANAQHQEQQLALDLDEGSNKVTQYNELTSETIGIEPEDSADPIFTQLNEPQISLIQAQAQEQLELELLEREETHRQEHDEAVDEEQKVRISTLKKELAEANKKADLEADKRVHAETHLRVTRKALSNLELKSRTADIETTDSQIELEDMLTENIRSVAVADARAEREEERRISIENELLLARQEILLVKKETRKNIAARAKILKTANKAILFARQSVNARANVEKEITDLKDKIHSQQDTITSLISSLEQEQKKSLEVKAFLTKQILKQKKTSNSESAHATQLDTLTSRLVKKVARSASPQI